MSTDHLEAVVYPTDESVAPGNRVSVVLDVTPKAEMHVYAPGSHAYQVISLRVNAQEGLVVHPAIYPESEIYHFEPLDERVEVYQQPFRVIQDVTIPITPETRERAQSGGTITVDGVFEYQACDDAICYNPVSLPVSWTLQLRLMVTN
ncbi:MAG: protein-disulfide reductase DsbD family protein [Vicinamibacterales bacterium]|nr:protein-disulfide reductase DsbD family protein [Vicinamibacterales bacterium]MDP7480807.1 protein-disulfide reductase DsbD family protein [Vicinamibacterales bacterium]MDP7691954.1 protein-disulfide reductase DsbD family protein [Vicinamibacterales bacterium]HJN44870.1 protein-disulfide reductase DsbD family protein [Vicinamibacterales bacterium]